MPTKSSNNPHHNYVGDVHPTMSEYRRNYIQGGTVFLTLVTYDRTPIFSNPVNIHKLRVATATTRKEMPFEILGAVILPGHIHFLWTLPSDDSNYSKRVGRLKVLFTQSLHGKNNLPQDVSISRQKHREINVWQHRFWEHTIRDEEDFAKHLDYIHYNPVKHGLASCPHQWEYSSFNKWCDRGFYSADWRCRCLTNKPQIPDSFQSTKEG